MKTKSIFFSLLFAASSFALFNCGGKKESADAHDHDAHEHQDSTEHVSSTSKYAEAAEPTFTVDAAFQQQLAGVFTSYITLKEAFVSSDAAKVKAEAGTTLAAIGKVDMKLLNGAAHNDWMNFCKRLNTSLQSIQQPMILKYSAKHSAPCRTICIRALRPTVWAVPMPIMSFARWRSTIRGRFG
jgi:hypothetical protein